MSECAQALDHVGLPVEVVLREQAGPGGREAEHDAVRSVAPIDRREPRLVREAAMTGHDERVERNRRTEVAGEPFGQPVVQLGLGHDGGG